MEKKRQKRKKKLKEKERNKGLLYRILNLPRPPAPVLVQVGTTPYTCRVNHDDDDEDEDDEMNEEEKFFFRLNLIQWQAKVNQISEILNIASFFF